MTAKISPPPPTSARSASFDWVPGSGFRLSFDCSLVEALTLVRALEEYASSLRALWDGVDRDDARELLEQASGLSALAASIACVVRKEAFR